MSRDETKSLPLFSEQQFELFCIPTRVSAVNIELKKEEPINCYIMTEEAYEIANVMYSNYQRTQKATNLKDLSTHIISEFESLNTVYRRDALQPLIEFLENLSKKLNAEIKKFVTQGEQPGEQPDIISGLIGAKLLVKMEIRLLNYIKDGLQEIDDYQLQVKFITVIVTGSVTAIFLLAGSRCLGLQLEVTDIHRRVTQILGFVVGVLIEYQYAPLLRLGKLVTLCKDSAVQKAELKRAARRFQIEESSRKETGEARLIVGNGSPIYTARPALPAPSTGAPAPALS